MEQTNILVVEDDRSLAQWIADYLTSHDYCVTLATRGDDAITLVREDRPDAVILDLNLPAVSGLDVCRQVRAFYDKPIIMLTARDAETDEVLGLETGADDYLTKPVRPAILLARLKALIRRQAGSAYESAITIGVLRVDFASRSVYLAENRVELTSHEFNVLWLLVQHAGEPLDRQTLISEIRGIEYDGFDRSVDICISRLRKKLDDVAETPRRIKTLRGVGYVLVRDAW
ncbi:MAG: response regulator [Granulosicoccus sp.]